MTEIERRKWIISWSTVANGNIFLGSLTFFMRAALVKKTIDEALTELENHCQGKSPAIRKTAYPAI
jgi:hypothetical protein